MLRTLAERIASFVDDGSYAYLLDRETTVPADAPLVAFDTRKVPRELSAAVLFVLAEHVTATHRAPRRRAPARDATAACSPAARCSSSTRRGSSSSAARPASGSTRSRAAPATSACSWSRSASSSRTSPAPTAGRCCATPPSSCSCASPPTSSPTSRTPSGSPTPRSRAIARLKTVKRAYSQAYWINGTRGRGTIALRVGPTEYGLATSDPVNDLPRRTQALDADGGDAWRALEQLAAEGWEAHR